MMGSLKLFGFALLLLSAVLAGRAYSSYCKRRTKEIESFLSFITHIKEKIMLFLSTPSSFAESYSDENLENSGFLPSLRDGEGLKAAFSKCSAKLAVGEEAKKRLTAFFADFGKNYKDTEIKRCELFCEELEKTLAAEREEEPKRIKLCYTLLFSAALAIIILLI